MFDDEEFDGRALRDEGDTGLWPEEPSVDDVSEDDRRGAAYLHDTIDIAESVR